MNPQSYDSLKRIKPDLMVHALLAEVGGTSERKAATTSHAGAPGVHVGTVDHLDGGRFIKLKKSDSGDARHHWIPIEWVRDVDDKAVYLNKTPDEVAQGLLDRIPQQAH
jgi:hypothetical protein